MAAFSNQHTDFIFDSFIVPTASNNMCSLQEQNTITSTRTCFPQALSNLDLHEIPLHAQIHEASPLNESISVKVPFTCTNTDSSVNVKEDTISTYSMVVDPFECGADQITHVVPWPVERKRKSIDMNVEGESKATEKRKHSGLKNAEKRRLIKLDAKKQKKVPEDAPTGYIHVRARRGQATDSHSLAERVRREKISVRMKILQSLVLGGDKMVGKAHILDEIIKYVQSLQNQVEFLSAKLASIDSMFSDFEVDYNTNRLESEKLFSLELPLPSVLESSSTQLTSFFETTPTSTSILLHDQEQKLYVNSQDEGNTFWGSDDQRENLCSQYALDNMCIF